MLSTFSYLFLPVIKNIELVKIVVDAGGTNTEMRNQENSKEMEKRKAGKKDH
jgi:hypothetical protein